MDDVGRVPIRKIGVGEEFNATSGTSMLSNIDFDFTERIYDVRYFGIMDLLSKLGGLRASIMPMLGYFVPFLTLHFLWSLAGIINEKLADLQREEMLILIKISRKQIKLILTAMDEGQIKLSKCQEKQVREYFHFQYDKYIIYNENG